MASTDPSPPIPQLHPHLPAGEFDLGALLELDPPLRWSPEPGDTVQGTVIQRVHTVSFGREAEELWLLVRDRWVVKVSCGGVVMARCLEEYDPQPDDLVAVRRNEDRVGQASGRTYRDFSYAQRRPAPPQEAT